MDFPYPIRKQPQPHYNGEELLWYSISQVMPGNYQREWQLVLAKWWQWLNGTDSQATFQAFARALCWPTRLHNVQCNTRKIIPSVLKHLQDCLFLLPELLPKNISWNVNNGFYMQLQISSLLQICLLLTFSLSSSPTEILYFFAII